METLSTRTAYRKSIFWFSHAQNERSCLQSPVVRTSTTPFSLFSRCAGNFACQTFSFCTSTYQIFRKHRKESSSRSSVLKYFGRHFKINVVPEAEKASSFNKPSRYAKIPNVYIFYADCSFLCRAHNTVFFTADDVKAKSVVGITLCVVICFHFREKYVDKQTQGNY